MYVLIDRFDSYAVICVILSATKVDRDTLEATFKIMDSILINIANQAYYNTSAGELKLGRCTQVQDPDNLPFEMASLASLAASVNQYPRFYDAFGLGMITSVCLPFYYQSNLKGVTCVDISMSDLLSDVAFFGRTDSSYAFIIDSAGRMLMHPLLSSPQSITDDPIFLPAISLEKGDSGNASFSSLRVVSRGDSVYTWKQDLVYDYVNFSEYFDDLVHSQNGDLLDSVIWTYVGFNVGVFRLYPGTRLNQEYDATKRPWYKRAVAQKGRIAFSISYKDAFGAGAVITMSKTILAGRCFMIDDGGFIIMHYEWLDLQDGKEAYHYVHSGALPTCVSYTDVQCPCANKLDFSYCRNVMNLDTDSDPPCAPFDVGPTMVGDFSSRPNLKRCHD
ncbi:hypothetical protein CAPTEDRAFT_196422 [Capitella teleta]|uniref:Cache domain-containing protein n=1 Tax=Capitella teleta TaxID=283909 RepID=R7TAF9_CAPTE|nr:hypothetical protein CAPTEDRAFT_196422 [Capitella teleta]|eukprot:ELT90477.1 hypothetical protein CAPTEDRAFT_196422 [Capitella teleta]